MAPQRNTGRTGGLDRFYDPFRPDHAGDDRDFHRRRQRQPRELRRVDPGPTDNRDFEPVRIEPEFPWVVAVLEQVVGVRAAQPEPDDPADHSAQDAYRPPLLYPKMTEPSRHEDERRAGSELGGDTTNDDQPERDALNDVRSFGAQDFDGARQIAYAVEPAETPRARPRAK